jgi:hypothetical protein
MLNLKKFVRPVLLLAVSIPAPAQDAPSTPSKPSASSTTEAGAVLFYADSGWSFGLQGFKPPLET